MDTQGLSIVQAPTRTDLRQGASNTAPTAAITAPVRTDVPNPVQQITQSADTVSVRKFEKSDSSATAASADLPFKDSLFPEVFPEPLPADLTAAERSQIYAQAFGPESLNADQRASAAARLFLTTANLFRD